MSFIKIITILSKESFLSKRSKLILDILQSEKIVTESKVLKFNKSICTYQLDSRNTIFRVHPDFEIPAEYLEFPKLYKITQKVANFFEDYPEYVTYYRFGPSSRRIGRGYLKGKEFVNDYFEKVPEYIESWTNEFGLCHRDNDYAEIYIRSVMSVVGKPFMLMSRPHKDFNGKPAYVHRGYIDEIKEMLKFDPNAKISHLLSGCKVHTVMNPMLKFVREDPTKPKLVVIFDEVVTFKFNNDTEECFFIDEPNHRKNIELEKVMEMIEDFGNCDSEGNDMSDRFIRNYLEMNPIQKDIGWNNN